MPSELLFHVAGPSAHAAEPISLAEPGLRERADLQEWVLKYPQMQLPGNVRLQVVVKRRLTVISRWKTGARIAQ